jgi:hypothetical protein
MNELELLNDLKIKGELVLTYLRINQETPVYNNNEFGQDIFS